MSLQLPCSTSMRILQVIHQYPPFSSQGSEVYCQTLSHCLKTLGDQVAVFHLSNTRPRRPRRLNETHQDGMSFYHCIDSGEYSRLANWPNHFLRESFCHTLATFQPDVVHFHNYLSLGDDLVNLAKTKGAKVIYTLHDYGLICPNALLLRHGGELCGKSTPDFFEGCCPELIRSAGGASPRFASRLPSLARWRQYANNQSNPYRRAFLRKAVGIAESILGAPETSAVAEKKSFFLQATHRIFQQVDLFLAPSAYLRGRYLACGIDPDRILHLRYGLVHVPRVPRQPRQDDRLRFGYIGAFHAHKGVDILLTAFRGLGDRASLHLHGSSFDSPVSEAHFKRSTAEPIPGVVLHGRYDNSAIGAILAGLDAVIVPSRWYENSPLTIQEAQIAGVPVITSDVGGMAELVRDGIDGRQFRCNDPMDLRRILLSLIEAPDQLKALRANAPEVPTIEQQSSKVRECYSSLLSSTAFS
jgi:glycosyltransferase involved in cell wall biosynthesis